MSVPECPVTCDPDCEVGASHCAYVHEPRHKRAHEPDACPTARPTAERAGDADDVAALAEVLYRARVKNRGLVHDTTPEYEWAKEVLAAGYAQPAAVPDPAETLALRAAVEALADELQAEFDLYRLEDPVHLRLRAVLRDTP